MVKQWSYIKGHECIDIMQAHFESQLKQLIIEDERSSPVTWFQSKWSGAKRLGRREQLRILIKDLT